MDTALADWMPLSSPTTSSDHAGIDHWLNEVPGLADDADLARSLTDFAYGDLLDDPSTSRAVLESDHVAPQLPSSPNTSPASSGGPGGEPAWSQEAPTSRSGSLSPGIVQMDRARSTGAIRSFSTNDLQLLQQLSEGCSSMSLPSTGLAGSYGSCTRDRPMGQRDAVPRLNSKSSARSALEPVPEGAVAPSQGVPSLELVPNLASAAPGSGASGCPSNPFTAISTTTNNNNNNNSGTTAQAAPGSTCTPPDDAADLPLLQAPVPQPQPTSAADGDGGGAGAGGGSGGSSGGDGGVGGGMRPVPSSGTLSALMRTTLHIQRDTGIHPEDGRPQQQQQPLQHPEPQPPQVPPFQQQLGTSGPPAALLAHAAVPPPCPGSAAQGALRASPLSMSSQPRPHRSSTSGPAIVVTTTTGAASCFIAQQASSGGTAAAAGGIAEGAGCSGGSGGGGGGGGAARALRKSQSALELGAWRCTAAAAMLAGGDTSDATAAATGQKLIGRLTPEERLQRILRYRTKRNQRNYNREIKYQCRKTLADSRPRVGGRFARNDDPNSVLPHQTKKAMRQKGQQPPQAQTQQSLQQACQNQAGETNAGGGRSLPQVGMHRQQQQQYTQQHQQQQRAPAACTDMLRDGAAWRTGGSAALSSNSAATTGAADMTHGSHGAAAAPMPSTAGAAVGTQLSPPQLPPQQYLPCGAAAGIPYTYATMSVPGMLPYSSASGFLQAGHAMRGSGDSLPPSLAPAPPSLQQPIVHPSFWQVGPHGLPLFPHAAAVKAGIANAPSSMPACFPTPTPTHGSPSFSQGGYAAGAVPPAATTVPAGAATAGAALTAAAPMALPARTADNADTADTNMATAAAAADAPVRLDSPLLDALLAHMDVEEAACDAEGAELMRAAMPEPGSSTPAGPDADGGEPDHMASMLLDC